MLDFQEAFANEDWIKYAELLQQVNDGVSEDVSALVKQLELDCKKISFDSASENEKTAAISFVKENHSKVLEML